MTEVLSLGDLYVSDFLADDEQPRAAPHDLTLVMDDDTAVVHLASQPAPELMWGRYWYRSGTNQSMTRELHGIVDQITELGYSDGLWVDIACNDGTLLAHTPTTFRRVGVDPVEGDIHDAATKWATIIQQPFTSSVAADIVAEYGRAKVVTCIAMFYDLLDPADFLAGVRGLLDDDGIFVLQMSYTPLMLRQLAFDNICHEHARYYTLTTLADTLGAAGFNVVDATLNDTNGGSLRVFAMRDDADLARFSSAPYRDVCYYRTAALLEAEYRSAVNTPAVWRTFAERLDKLRDEVLTFVKDVRSQGCTVWGYGASTKGNTLLQYFGLNHELVDAIAERQPQKWGLRTVGTDIPIRSEADMRAACPDYMLMLPWQFVREFLARELNYLDGGGKFIVPCPRFEIMGSPKSNFARIFTTTQPPASLSA